MRIYSAIILISIIISATASEAQQRSGGGGGGGGGGRGDGVRAACKEEARRVVKPGRTTRMDQEQLREMRREYQRDCRKKARAA